MAVNEITDELKSRGVTPPFLVKHKFSKCVAMSKKALTFASLRLPKDPLLVWKEQLMELGRKQVQVHWWITGRTASHLIKFQSKSTSANLRQACLNHSSPLGLLLNNLNLEMTLMNSGAGRLR